MHRSKLVFALIVMGAPAMAEMSDEEVRAIVGIDPGYYAYEGKCEQIRDATGNISPYVIAWDGRNIITSENRCRIVDINMESDGWFAANYDCFAHKTGEQTKSTQALRTIGDETMPANTVQMGQTFVDGVVTAEAYPEPLVFCQSL